MDTISIRSAGSRRRSAIRRTLTAVLAVMSGVTLAACTGLLDVTDPTLVQDSDLANASGANARRLSVVSAFNESVAVPFASEAMFTDERMFDVELVQNGGIYLILDSRDTAKYQASYGASEDPLLAPLTNVLTYASIALPGIRAYAADSVRNEYIAQMYAFRGFAILQMAEEMCSGFPIDEVQNGLSVYSQPYTTERALRYAISTLDTALDVGRDSVRFLNFARVLKARALVDLGEYDSAKAVVASVPTSFAYRTDNGAGGSFGGLYTAQSFLFSAPQAVGNREGGVGLPFASARDPRVPSVYVQMRYRRTADTVSDSLRDQLTYASSDAPVLVASGIEARLIEAEAALNANDPATWLATLNTLRDVAITPAMPHLADPGPATRVDTMFKERAFWLYLTGHRLGDMRRLVHRYGRAVNAVYPTGTHPLGAPYVPATSIPFIFANAAQFNPHITSGCAPE